jgi:hypothetical protein
LSFGTPPKLVETRKNPTTPAQDKTPSSRKRRALQEIGGEVELSEKLITLILLIAAQALMAGIAYSGFMAISYAISVAPAVAANLGIAAWQLPAASAIGSAIISVVKNKDGLFGGNEKAQYKSLRQTLIDMVLIDAGITTIGSLAAVLPASGFDALRAAYQVSSDLPIAEQWGLIVKGLKESASNLLIYVGGAAALALLIKTIYQRRFKSGSSE